MSTPDQLYEAYIFDLDGTIYLGDALLPTVQDTLLELRQLGRPTVFLSNNPTHSRFDYAKKLTRLGVPTSIDDIINSSVVMVDFLRQRMPGARLFVVGEQPLCDELRSGGFTLTDDALKVDAVIASFDRTFEYRKLQIAFDAIRHGARLFATNADRFCPVPGGGEPDAAAVIAAIEACTSHTLEAMVGKPSRFMTEALFHKLQLPPEKCLMTGDRLETDVQMGLLAGMHTALAMTGATTYAMLQISSIQPNYVINRIEELILGLR